jgi:Rrf2 family transcriptional regulator, nitric oxide-sensitive transcriptional repressor
MLSQSAEYVLRVVVHLAGQQGQARTTRQIAQATRVPEGYLSKLLQNLGRAGLVSSQRGLHGGFILARPPADLSVLEVITAVDPPKRTDACPLGLPAHKGSLCPLHEELNRASEMVQQAFASTTIARFMDDHQTERP